MENHISKPKIAIITLIILVAMAFGTVSCSNTYVDKEGNVWAVKEVCTDGAYVDEPAYMLVPQPDGSTQMLYYTTQVYKCYSYRSDTVYIGKQKDLK